MKKNQNHIHLFGNPEENFYVLGKRDKDSYSEVYHQISMLCARNTMMTRILKITTELSTQMIKKKSNRNMSELKAYAEGLEKPLSDVLFALLLPEIVASFNKWVPDLMSLIPGCSSLFIKDPKTNDIIHSRVLDYALSGPYEKYERSILYDFQDRYKSFSLSSTGMPTPSMSAMNEKGLSMALHYKHGQYFNLEGDSIFFITSEIMNHCANIREAIKFIKSQQSISYWGLYLADSNGEVASIDIRGREIYQEKFDLKDHQYLYFNNRPLLRQNDLASIQPFGNQDQCRMRRNSVTHQLEKIDFSNSSDIMLDSLKALGKPIDKKSKTAIHWNFPAITPSSIQLYSFNISQFKSLMIPGEAPKYFNGQYHQYTDIFSNIKLKNNIKNKKESSFVKGNKKLAKFQSFIDRGEISSAYHEIQMAIELLQGYPEYFIAKFFFSVTQYIYESDKRDLTYLYHDFESLDKKLPAYLEDHRKLFILRLAKINGHKIQNLSNQIKNNELKKIYLNEVKLNPTAIKGLKYLIFPRIEILDIIYAF